MRNPNSAVSEPNSFVTSSGDTFHVRLSPRVCEDGQIKLTPAGKDDIKASINSFRDSTDMSYILQRMAAGDLSVLNAGSPMFGDFTQMPRTYAEALQLVIDGRREFEALPLSVRNKFDNDFNRYLATAGSDEWYEKISSHLTQTSDSASATSPVDDVSPSQPSVESNVKE